MHFLIQISLIIMLTPLSARAQSLSLLEKRVRVGGANVDKAREYVGNVYQPKIAIIDYGISLQHKFYSECLLTNDNEIPNNGIDDDGNGYIDDYYGFNSVTERGNADDFDFKDSEEAHGTEMIGLISASPSKFDRSQGFDSYSSVTECYKVIPVVKGQIFRDDEVPSLVKAFEYALDRGADIINYSQNVKVTSAEFKQVMKRAYDSNVIIVVAAGNSGERISFDVNQYPTQYASDFSNIIVVGATWGDSKRASSNYGEAVHVFSPGEYLETACTSYSSHSQSYSHSQCPTFGTSAAAAIVSGVVALVLATHGPSSASSMRHRLIDSSQRRGLSFNMQSASQSGGAIDAAKAILWTEQ